MTTTITDKTILITGANRGIGKVLTEHLLAAGAARIYTAVRRPDSVQELVQQYGDRIVPVQLDLADPASIQAAAERAGDVDIVINNAGVLQATELLGDEALEALRFELDINLYGLLHMARAFAPVLARQGGGAFVQLNSVVSVKAFSNFATYSASKAAAYSITQSLRDVLGEQGTQVVSVHPGPIATDMSDAAGFTEMAVSADVVAEALIAGLAQGDFHVFPDPMAQQIWEAYQGFAGNVVEADLSEA